MMDNISDMWMYEAGRAYGGRMELVEIAVILLGIALAFVMIGAFIEFLSGRDERRGCCRSGCCSAGCKGRCKEETEEDEE